MDQWGVGEGDKWPGAEKVRRKFEGLTWGEREAPRRSLVARSYVVWPECDLGYFYGKLLLLCDYTDFYEKNFNFEFEIYTFKR